MKQHIDFARTPSGCDIAYAVSGTGTPLVFSGGFLTHLQNDWTQSVWSHWFEFLCERHQLIRFDHRGTGLSDSTLSSLTLDDWVEDLHTVVEACRLEQFAYFGMFQNAAVGVQYALTHPGRLTQLVAYAPVVTGWHRGESELDRKWQAMEQLVVSGWTNPDLAFPAMLAQMIIPGAAADDLRRYAEVQRKSVCQCNIDHLLRVAGNLSLFPRLAEVSVPTLVVQIAGNMSVHPATAVGIAQRIPESEFVSIDSNNQILTADEPGWEEFKRHFTANVLGGTAVRPAVNATLLDTLSAREHELLMEMSKGATNREIGERLFISEKTVRNHVTNILDKLQLSSRAQAIVMIKDLGL